VRPTPIPDNEIWTGAQRVVFAAPNGDLTDAVIAPVEALVDRSPSGFTCASVRCALEPGDLEKLTAGGTVWVTFYGRMTPFSVDVLPPPPKPDLTPAAGADSMQLDQPTEREALAPQPPDDDPAERELREAGYEH
jgi:hypothetical protein